MNRNCLRSVLAAVLFALLMSGVAWSQTTDSRQLPVAQQPLARPASSGTAASPVVPTAAPNPRQTMVAQGTQTTARQGVPQTAVEKPLTPPADAGKGTSSSDSKNESDSKDASGKKHETARKSLPGLRQLLVSIGLLSLLFVVLILLLKKLRPKEAGKLPPDVFEVLGKSPLAFRQQVYFLRGGDRIFLVALSANGVDKIGEITDPGEVARVIQRCHGEPFIPATGSVGTGGNAGTTGTQGNAGGQPASNAGNPSLEELYQRTLRR